MASYQYTLSPTGLRTQVVEASGRRVNYRYDALGRLVEEQLNSPVEGEKIWRYQYDAVGNRLQKEVGGQTLSYRYDENDRLLEVGGMNYEYDAEGNLLKRSQGTAQSLYAYDAQQRLVEGVTETGQVRYEYDAEGYRVSKQVGGEVTTYVMDDHGVLPQVVAELDEQGRVKVGYEYGGDRLLSQDREGKVFYSHTDGLGSVRVLTDEVGRKTDSYEYEAFGELLGSEGGTPHAYRFAGERFEAELGWYDLRARFYDPEVGRFTQRDSFEGWGTRPVTLHKYLYANGDPVNWVDPTGKVSITNVALGVVVGSFISYGLYKWLPILDMRRNVYLDFSRMGQLEFIRDARLAWDENEVKSVVVDTLKESYDLYGINLLEGRGHFLERTVEFEDGTIPSLYGTGYWLWGNVYTNEIAKSVNRKFSQVIGSDPISGVKLWKYPSSSELGIAIGNVAAHEMGHLYVLEHECVSGYIMTVGPGEELSTCGTEGAVQELSLNRLPWSEQSKSLLKTKFQN